MLPIGDTASGCCDVTEERLLEGFAASVQKKLLAPPAAHTPEEYGFADRLYAGWWPQALARGVVRRGTLAAAIETCREEWPNRLRVTERWVA